MGTQFTPSTAAVVKESSLTSLPKYAVTTGIATSDHGNRVGVFGSSVSNIGVYAESTQSIGLYATGGLLAAQFEGNVEILSGDLKCNNADCAEEFDVAADSRIEPGTVVILSDQGTVSPSTLAYDTRVAGVVSGAGGYSPAIILDKQSLSDTRRPIALLGKAYCKVDASYGAITVGDLLTTSHTPGHAMKVSDREKAFGAVIGKALCPLSEGQGLIPLLLTLH